MSLWTMIENLRHEVCGIRHGRLPGPEIDLDIEGFGEPANLSIRRQSERITVFLVK